MFDPASIGMSAISGLVSGGMSMLSNWLQRDDQRAASDEQYARQYGMFKEQEYANVAGAREQRDWSAGQAAQAMDFSADQADIARQFSAAQQTRAEEFNASQAELNRRWQERMSSTAYQRSRADMAAAGLNPILAAGAGGASTPSGGQGSIGAIGGPAASGTMGSGAASSAGLAQVSRRDVPNLMAGVVSSAVEAAKLKPVLDILEQDLQTKRWETQYGESNTLKNRAETEYVDTQRKLAEAQTAEVKKRTHQMGADTSIFGVGSGNMQWWADQIARILSGGQPGSLGSGSRPHNNVGSVDPRAMESGNSADSILRVTVPGRPGLSGSIP